MGQPDMHECSECGLSDSHDDECVTGLRERAEYAEMQVRVWKLTSLNHGDSLVEANSRVANLEDAIRHWLIDGDIPEVRERMFALLHPQKKYRQAKKRKGSSSG